MAHPLATSLLLPFCFSSFAWLCINLCRELKQMTSPLSDFFWDDWHEPKFPSISSLPLHGISARREMEKEARNHYHTRGSSRGGGGGTAAERDLLLQWGNRKRLRCVKVQRRDVEAAATAAAEKAAISQRRAAAAAAAAAQLHPPGHTHHRVLRSVPSSILFYFSFVPSWCRCAHCVCRLALCMIALFWWLLVKLVPIFGLLFGKATTGCHVISSWARGVDKKSRGLIWFGFDLRRIQFEWMMDNWTSNSKMWSVFFLKSWKYQSY